MSNKRKLAHTALRYRLQGFVRLDGDDIQSFEAMLGEPREFSADEVLVPAGQQQSHALVVASGWCTRSQMDADGRRQIINFLLPGEMAGVFLGVYPAAEYQVAALTDVTVWRIAGAELAKLFGQAPRLALALTWMAARDERLLEQQIVRLGLRDSIERLADLLAELYHRQIAVGIAAKQAAELPITQSDLADILGLSRVHTNRVCQALTETGAISTGRGMIQIADIKRLERVAAFSDAYLNGNGA